jgi:hypothetical protein
MPRPLTYPPEILIESSIELPPEFAQEGADEGWFELILLFIELLLEL